MEINEHVIFTDEQAKKAKKNIWRARVVFAGFIISNFVIAFLMKDVSLWASVLFTLTGVILTVIAPFLLPDLDSLKPNFEALEKQKRDQVANILMPVRNKINSQWVAHAYPLKQIVIKVQGTRHQEKAALIGQLEIALERLKKGDAAGQEHDDDFGYFFEYTPEAVDASFFSEPAGSR